MSPHLEVPTPERIALAFPLAGIGFRSIAYLVDGLILFFSWIAAYFAFSLIADDFAGTFLGLSGLGKTLLVLGVFCTQWLYWTCCEVFGRGQTPGKRLLRIRVVSDDGSAVSVFQSAVRNLCRVVDFLPLFYALGLLTMLASRENRRLGDLLAGTVLVREEPIDLSKYSPPSTVPIQALPSAIGMPPLTNWDVELILSYLARASQLNPEPRNQLANALLDRYAERLPEEERRAVAASLEKAEAFLRMRVQAQG